jgi:hypothetical protein
MNCIVAGGGGGGFSESLGAAGQQRPQSARTPNGFAALSRAASPAGEKNRLILGGNPLQVLGKEWLHNQRSVYVTRWCHYQTLAPTQKGEESAPGDENDQERKGPKRPCPTSGNPLNSAFRVEAVHPQRVAALSRAASPAGERPILSGESSPKSWKGNNNEALVTCLM